MGDSTDGWKTGKVIAHYRGNDGWKSLEINPRMGKELAATYP